MNIKKIIKDNYYLVRCAFFVIYELPVFLLGDKKIIEKKHKKLMGFKPNLVTPRFMSEKIQWLKLYDRNDFNTLAADKYRIRDYYIKNFGEEYVTPLLKKYDSWRDIEIDNLPEAPFIIKANTGSGTWRIIRDKSDINIKELKLMCRKWMYLNHYYTSQEWQYKNIKPCIIVEKLLVDNNGKIPVDYKLHYMNGELQFIYCVVDREGDSYRAMFSPTWELLPFQWVSVNNHKPLRTTVDEPAPHNLSKMIEFGNVIAKKFKYYVRVDFMEINDKLYFSEITMHHGSGMNKFFPPTAEREYINKIVIK